MYHSNNLRSSSLKSIAGNKFFKLILIILLILLILLMLNIF